MSGDELGELGHRVARVNGIDVSARPLCAAGSHHFAAHHGYCLDCGLDGWLAEFRRAVEREQGGVIR